VNSRVEKRAKIAAAIENSVCIRSGRFSLFDISYSFLFKGIPDKVANSEQRITNNLLVLLYS